MANECKTFVAAVVRDMAKYDGSGNAVYYEKTVADIVSAFPSLAKNALLRNEMRKSLHPELRDEFLSEDSKCDKGSSLRVPKGTTPRRTHPEDNFVVTERNIGCKQTAAGMKCSYFVGSVPTTHKSPE